MTNPVFPEPNSDNISAPNFPDHRKRREFLLKLIHQQTNAAAERILSARIIDNEKLQSELSKISVYNRLRRTGTWKCPETHSADKFPFTAANFQGSITETQTNAANGNFVCGLTDNNNHVQNNVENLENLEEEIHSLEWTTRFDLHEDLAEYRKTYLNAVKALNGLNAASSSTLTAMEEGEKMEPKLTKTEFIDHLLRLQNGKVINTLSLASRIQQNKWLPDCEEGRSILNMITPRWSTNFKSRHFSHEWFFILAVSAIIILGKYVFYPLFKVANEFDWPWLVFMKPIPPSNGLVYDHFDVYGDDGEDRINVN